MRPIGFVIYEMNLSYSAAPPCYYSGTLFFFNIMVSYNAVRTDNWYRAFFKLCLGQIIASLQSNHISKRHDRPLRINPDGGL